MAIYPSIYFLTAYPIQGCSGAGAEKLLALCCISSLCGLARDNQLLSYSPPCPLDYNILVSSDMIKIFDFAFLKAECTTTPIPKKLRRYIHNTENIDFNQYWDHNYLSGLLTDFSDKNVFIASSKDNPAPVRFVYIIKICSLLSHLNSCSP